MKHAYSTPTPRHLAGLVACLLLLLSNAAVAAPTANDEPGAAKLLPLLTTCTPLSGTTVDATPSSQPAADGQQMGGGLRADVFYTFIAPCSRISLTLSDMKSATYGSVFGNITLYRFSAGSYTREPDNGRSTNDQLNSLTLLPGQRYYLRVQTLVYNNGVFYGTPATFSLCATVPYTQFGPATAYPYLYRASYHDDFDVGDFDGDRYPDLVVLSTADTEIQLRLNQRNGTFSAGARLYSRWTSIEAVALGDLDKDGRADIVAAGHTYFTDGIQAGVEVTLTKANGPLTSLYSTNAGGSANPDDVTLSDVNGDGFPDIIAYGISCNVAVLLNKGNGTFAPAVVYNLADARTQYPRKIVTADVNGDGFRDIVTIVATEYAYSAPDIDKIGIFLNRGDGTFSPIQHIGPAQNSSYSSLAAGDVNGDATADLVVVNRINPDNITVFLNQGNGNFAPGKIVYASSTDLKKVVLADLNADGALDLLVAADRAKAIVLFNNKNGTFGKGGTFLEETYSTTPGTATSGVSDVLAVDVNLDGKVDIVANNIYENELGVLLNQGACLPTSVTSAASAPQRESASLAPNPAHGNTTVYLPAAVSAKQATVTLQDALGRTVRTYLLANAQKHLDLSGLLPGVYLVHIQAGEQTLTHRLLVN